MCGILGLIALNKNTINPFEFAKMNNLQRHRGPDDEGYIFYNYRSKRLVKSMGEETMSECKKHLASLESSFGFNIALGFRRLSIVDLSFYGHQPMSDYSNRYHIIFNGEIFNYKELRQELQQHGFEFHTHTDTEVILNAFIYWGEECLTRFNGMWAIAILDSIDGSLFLARDRFGIKPLYIYQDKATCIAFSSEMKPLLAAFHCTENRGVIGNYLYRGITNYNNETFWNEIQQIPPGCFAKIFNGEITTQRYYEIPENRFEGNFESACLQFTELLASSLSLRERSDVKLGFALSGGIDSSSLVGLSRKINKGNNIATYSLIFPNAAENEEKFMKAVVDMHKIPAIEFTFNHEELISDLEVFCLSQEQPFGGLSYFGEFKLKEKMHQAGVVVSIEGQGADEIISGYNNLIPFYLADLLKDREVRNFYHRSKSFSGSLSSVTKIVLKILLKEHQLITEKIDVGKYASINSDIFHPSILPHVETQEKSLLNKELKNQLLHTSLPEQLIKADKSSMQFSIEARFPFLDYRVVNFANSLPYHYKLNDKTKRILRESMKEVLPSVIYERKDKIGFAVPIKQISSEKLFTRITETLMSTDFEGFDKTSFLKEFGSATDINWKFWKISSLILWHEVYKSFKNNNKLNPISVE